LQNKASCRLPHFSIGPLKSQNRNFTSIPSSHPLLSYATKRLEIGGFGASSLLYSNEFRPKIIAAFFAEASQTIFKTRISSD
jgi:hypothetical protein